MSSDRVVVQFIVNAEMPNNEDSMEFILAALTTAIEDTEPEAVNVYADIMDVEPIT